MEKLFALYLIQAGFIVLSLICFILICMGLLYGAERSGLTKLQQRKFIQKFVVIFFGWVIILAVLSLSGFLYNFSTLPPRMVIVFIIPLIFIIATLFSRSFSAILAHIPPQWLIYLQAFRFFVELLLWGLFLQNLIPVQMSFEGRNWDVITGITAPFAAYLLISNAGLRKWLGIMWNIMGLVLLVNILTIALLSFPTPMRMYMNEPANTIVAKFPYVLLPGVLVPIAYALHIYSLKQLIRR